MAGNLTTTVTRLKQEQKVSRRVQALVLGREPAGCSKSGHYFPSHESWERSCRVPWLSRAGWLWARGVRGACSLLNAVPSVSAVKLSGLGQCLPVPLWVVKTCETKQAVSEKALCYLMQYAENSVGIFISHLENSGSQIVTRNFWSNDISKFFITSAAHSGEPGRGKL